MASSAPIPPDATISLPDGTSLSLTYLAEGGAHILYIPAPISPSHSLPAPFANSLLRFRKSGPSCAQRVRDHLTRIAPLFSPDFTENLLNLELYTLPPDTHVAMIAELNASLQRREETGSRLRERFRLYLPSEEEGEAGFILVRDLRAREAKGEVLVEFKPKWLVQSPSAPKGAKRCRTCALRRMRRDDGKMLVKGRELMPFCPFDLLAEEEEGKKVAAVLTGLGFPMPVKQETITQFRTLVRPVLLRLRDLQREYSGIGLEDSRAKDSPAAKEFSLAMALRDCSLFILVGEEGTVFKEVMLADVDLKEASEEKLRHWIGTETRLIEEGWYTAEEKDIGSREEEVCQVGLL